MRWLQRHWILYKEDEAHHAAKLSFHLQLVDPSITMCHSRIQNVTRKQKKQLKRNAKQKEYKKLKVMIPKISKIESVPEVTVIEEALKYIDQLQEAVAVKFNIPEDDVRDIAAKKMIISTRSFRIRAEVGDRRRRN
ncbi:hypothetical protein CHS0354_021287 [Potamilus streckersoni]|uniref:BHLH domain-containing protein n=1 Tax=Potamilus streckersoni TaxID=2493646 RepID=A0AAE0WEN2_9BIVA|nr:hypothetical protein CHS0354_021287 [Potamilus streckersoni]